MITAIAGGLAWAALTCVFGGLLYMMGVEFRRLWP